MTVDDLVAERIAAARARAESARRRRAAQRAARQAGLAHRHATKLRHQAERRGVATPTAKKETAMTTTTEIALCDDRETKFIVQTVAVSSGECSHGHGACGKPGVTAVRNTVDQQNPTEVSTLRVTLCADHQDGAARLHSAFVADAREMQDPVKRAEYLASAGVTD